TCRWLLLIGEFDRRSGAGDWECRSTAHWLNWRCGVSMNTAREYVRVGVALGELPTVAAAFGRGELSYSKVRAITRIAMHDHDDPAGPCELEDGCVLAPETARRLACDAAIIPLLEHDGEPLSIGRKTQSIPPAIRRALKSPDKCCRFPGCGLAGYLRAHHITFWAKGGATSLINLLLLCW